MPNQHEVENALKAAFEGPEIKGIKINGHTFNVKPMAIHRSGNNATANGHISHHLANRPDDQVHFTLSIVNGVPQKPDVSIDPGGWPKILETIAGFLPDSWTEDAIGIKEKDVVAAVKNAGKLLEGDKWEGAMSFLLAIFLTRLASNYNLGQMSNALSEAKQLRPWNIYITSALNGQPFGGWSEVQSGGTTDRSVTAAAFGSRLYVAAKGVDDATIYVNSALDQHAFDGWSQVPSGGTPHALAMAGFVDRLYLFAVGFDGKIYINSAREGHAFEGWSEVQGQAFTNKPVAACAFKDRLFCFGIGTDDQIYVNSAVHGQPFGTWDPIPSGGTPHGVAAAVLGERLYIFVTGYDGRIYGTSALYGQPFDPLWEVQGGGTTDSKVSAASFAGRLYICAKGIGDKGIYINSAAMDHPFDGWSPIPGQITYDAPAIAAFSGRLYVFAEG
jgi:hypothetical protein